MTVSALTSPSLFSPVSSLASSTSTQAAFFAEAGDESDDPAAVNNLTGSGTASLASQTLQALLDMTQSDPSGTTTQNSQGAQGAHHHHHHGGHHGPQQASATDPADSTAQDAATAADQNADTPESALTAAG